MSNQSLLDLATNKFGADFYNLSLVSVTFVRGNPFKNNLSTVGAVKHNPVRKCWEILDGDFKPLTIAGFRTRDDALTEVANGNLV